EVAGDAAWYLPTDSMDEWDEVFQSVLYNTSERRRKQTRGLRRLKQYSWARSAQKYLDTVRGNERRNC
ncbi:MAG: hypothetical protein ABEJ65_09500, partial [bacterium]